jgi:hypothetical protein
LDFFTANGSLFNNSETPCIYKYTGLSAVRNGRTGQLPGIHEDLRTLLRLRWNSREFYLPINCSRTESTITTFKPYYEYSYSRTSSTSTDIPESYFFNTWYNGTAEEFSKVLHDYVSGSMQYKSGDHIVTDTNTHFPLNEYFDRMKSVELCEA